jgi:hypothetical protein
MKKKSSENFEGDFRIKKITGKGIYKIRHGTSYFGNQTIFSNIF